MKAETFQRRNLILIAFLVTAFSILAALHPRAPKSSVASAPGTSWQQSSSVSGK